jgi:hypothetical protein
MSRLKQIQYVNKHYLPRAELGMNKDLFSLVDRHTQCKATVVSKVDVNDNMA